MARHVPRRLRDEAEARFMAALRTMRPAHSAATAAAAGRGAVRGPGTAWPSGPDPGASLALRSGDREHARVPAGVLGQPDGPLRGSLRLPLRVPADDGDA